MFQRCIRFPEFGEFAEFNERSAPFRKISNRYLRLTSWVRTVGSQHFGPMPSPRFRSYCGSVWTSLDIPLNPLQCNWQKHLTRLFIQALLRILGQQVENIHELIGPKYFRNFFALIDLFNNVLYFFYLHVSLPYILLIKISKSTHL